MYLIWLTLQIVGLVSSLPAHIWYTPKTLDSEITGSWDFTSGMGASQLGGRELPPAES